ncbi:hypothetical protein [Sphingomonas sp. TREG-RG-20F-R18-01]|uniref:hypothetical protein n=1 Tax=Sphingomonas sp. TREG-RG-20F-R18-01 TaxID=2914982 RepID=UPI001F58C435|nr:hypothetical protein [Sphingomonas sp. TREG-RG-20F-R18-01]
MKVEVGKVYVDDFNTRRTVVAINGDTLIYHKRLSSMENHQMPLAEFETWAVAEFEPFVPPVIEGDA